MIVSAARVRVGTLAVLTRPVRVKCSPDDTIGDLKKLIAAQKGTKPEKVRRWSAARLMAPGRPQKVVHDLQGQYSPVRLRGARAIRCRR